MTGEGVLKNEHPTMDFSVCTSVESGIAACYVFVNFASPNRATKTGEEPGYPRLHLRQRYHLTNLTDQCGQTTPAGRRCRASESSRL